ncbi:MAG: cytochrome c3 family protein, partial [Thermoanaerobaculales bacterium]|nr:cytochrome c3 family protein [Thermoanaerobaculales bacterium]
TSPLNDIAPTDRSCVNMCHQDHVHNSPGGTTHDFNVHQDASTPTSRVVGRNIDGEIIAGTPARTDFDPGAANGGLCISCHQNAVATNGPTIDTAAYDASAHDFTSNAFGTWSYVLHDGSTFDRNCTKCHADRSDARPSASGLSLGAVHFSDFPDLLTGSVNPNGNPTDFVCYTCHGNPTTGVDLSGKDLVTAVAKTSNHPVESDSVHDTLAEKEATFNDGTFSGANRHVSCLDCHGPHEAQPGLHTAGTAGFAGALAGATGIGVTALPAEWTAFGAGDLTTNPGAASAEYQICFKCHSPFAYDSSPPTGETDQALEFNVNNDSYHWIMTDQTATQAPDWATANTTPRTDNTSRYMAFTTGSPWAKDSPMVCSDCHGNDDPAGVQGPHGSANASLLSKPWSASSGISTPDGLCFDCHDFQTYAGESGSFGQTGFASGRGSKNLHGSHSARYPSDSTEPFRCAWCHSAVPHGWNRKALVILDSDPAPYNIDGNTAQTTSWNISNTRRYGKNSCGTVGACH